METSARLSHFFHFHFLSRTHKDLLLHPHPNPNLSPLPSTLAPSHPRVGSPSHSCPKCQGLSAVAVTNCDYIASKGVPRPTRGLTSVAHLIRVPFPVHPQLRLAAHTSYVTGQDISNVESYLLYPTLAVPPPPAARVPVHAATVATCAAQKKHSSL